MKLQSCVSTLCLVAAALTIAPGASAHVITTLNEGSDWTLQRNDTTATGSDDGRLLVKNQGIGFDSNDRVGVAEFDTSSLGPVTVASVRFQMANDAANNNFLAGETIQLWGVADGHANEGFTQSVAFPDNPFVGDDTTDNLVIDANLVFLGEITFAANTDGNGIQDYLDFFGPSVTAFVQADTNNVLKFLLTAVGNTSGSRTPFLTHEEGLISGDTYPSVLTNADAVVPEPGSLALLGLGGLMVARRHRK